MRTSVSARLIEFAETKGGLRSLSRLIGKSDNYLAPYAYGKSEPGHKLQAMLRDVGCDIEWLMTGKESNQRSWKGLSIYGTNDPPPKTHAKLMLSPAHCGDPSEVDESIAAYIDVSKYHNKDTFYVQARGESMTGADINEGDMLLVDTAKEPKNGNIVLVRIGDRVSVKRLRKNGEEFLLAPENPDFDPIPVSGDTHILAVVLRADKWLV
ncbi:MAG: hypothetical protein HYZ54_08775 [Ignavibacteriae bacterium]|nr:hypothetical protein [Ignavibacteriota bacterium]